MTNYYSHATNLHANLSSLVNTFKPLNMYLLSGTTLLEKKLTCMHGHGEIDFRKEKNRTKNKLVSTKSIFFRIFSNCSVIVLQKPHKISLLLDPKALV